MQKLKDMHEAAEKLRREKWIEEKTKKIKVCKDKSFFFFDNEVVIIIIKF